MDLHAWRQFRGKLADYIMKMSDGDVLLIEYRRTTSAGDSACVQFFAWGGDLVRCEIPSNEYLHSAFRLDERSRERLLELGWLAPNGRPNGSRSYHLDRLRTRCDEIAAHTVTVLRELWGVPHPALLDCTSGGGPQTPPFTVREAVPPAELDFGSAIHPTSRHHLQLLVQRTMAQVLGTAPPVSETGSVDLDMSFGLVLIEVHRREPLVELTGWLARKIVDDERARRQIQELDLRLPPDWSVDEDGVMVTVPIDAAPFVPRHLVNALHDFLEKMRELDAELPWLLGDAAATVSTLAVHPPQSRAESAPRPAAQLELFDRPVQPTLFDEPLD